MTLSHEEREAFRSTVRSFVDERAPVARARLAVDDPDGHDADLWASLAGELGLQGIEVPEPLGGSGLGFGEVALAQSELGRRLVCTPFLASAVLATGALLAEGGEDVQRELLPRLADGSLVGTVVHGDPSCGWEPSGAVEAHREGGGHVLDGEVGLVPDALAADLLVVLAAAPAGPTAFLVEAGASGLSRSSLPVLDGTRRLGTVRLEGVRSRALGKEGSAGPLAELLLDRAAVALAAEQAGAAAALLELSVEHAKTREQFGRPIGAFQAVKHTCARMLIDAESAAAVATHAARIVDGDGSGRSAVASLAKVHCCQAGTRVASAAIQVHGGLGFTWEHDAHLYYRRALSSEQLFGGVTWHRERLLRHLETSATGCFA